MLLWNTYCAIPEHRRPNADYATPAAVRGFANKHAADIAADVGLKRCMTLHLLNLWDFGLVASEDVEYALKQVAAAVAAAATQHTAAAVAVGAEAHTATAAQGAASAKPSSLGSKERPASANAAGRSKARTWPATVATAATAVPDNISEQAPAVRAATSAATAREGAEGDDGATTSTALVKGAPSAMSKQVQRMAKWLRPNTTAVT